MLTRTPSTSYGVDLKYRFDGGGLFSQARLKAKTKVESISVSDLLFADDCALNARSEEDMQASMNLFSNACSNFGLTISTAKTEVLHQPAPGSEYTPPEILCNGKQLLTPEAFIEAWEALFLGRLILTKQLPEDWQRQVFPLEASEIRCGKRVAFLSPQN